MPRLQPLPPDTVPELKEVFQRFEATMGFIPNSQLILQRKPKVVQAMRSLQAAIFDPEGEVSIAFKRLLAYVVARVHGCSY